MNPFLTVAVNLASCPGVKNSGLQHKPDGTVCVSVTGGNPKTVAAMILQCLPPGTETSGSTEVEVEGTIVRFEHKAPDPDLPEDYVAPLPLITPEGEHKPMGVQLGKPSPHATGSFAQPMFWFGVAAVAIIAGIALLLLASCGSEPHVVEAEKPVVVETQKVVEVPQVCPDCKNWWPDCEVDNITGPEGDWGCRDIRFAISKQHRYHIQRGKACEAAGNTVAQCGCWIYGTCDWYDNSQALDVETPEERHARREANKPWRERHNKK